MLTKLEIRNPGHVASTDDTGNAAECDEDGESPACWQDYNEDEIQASMRSMPEFCNIETPDSLIGNGAFDPFNAMPVVGCAKYNSHLLNHCRRHPPSPS